MPPVSEFIHLASLSQLWATLTACSMASPHFPPPRNFWIPAPQDLTSRCVIKQRTCMDVRFQECRLQRWSDFRIVRSLSLCSAMASQVGYLTLLRSQLGLEQTRCALANGSFSVLPRPPASCYQGDVCSVLVSERPSSFLCHWTNQVLGLVVLFSDERALVSLVW